MQTEQQECLQAIPSSWLDLFRDHLPGYDPLQDADGYVFRADVADFYCAFFENYELIEGEHAGQRFKLEDWQRAIVGCMYGWIDPDTGLRRYREVFIYVPRKNGKTMLAAGLVLNGLFVDDEPGAQIYSAAAEREQAALVYRQAQGIIARNPTLAQQCKVYRTYKSIEVQSRNAIYKALSADADTKHGLGPHLTIVDELHVHKDDKLVEALQTASGSRRQPLLIHITTADYERPSICNTKHTYARMVADGTFKDASFLPVLYEASVDDDWTDPAVWAKCNPNINVSVREEFLKRECERAQNEPSYENSFKRLHLNIKTQQSVRWLPMNDWDQCGDQPVCEGPCFAGIDLSTTTDLSALVLYWPETHSIVPYFWIPEDNAKKREERDKVPYLTWAKQGLLTMTPGDVIDYTFIMQQCIEVMQTFDIKKFAYDPWNATQFAVTMQDEHGAPMYEYRQGFGQMNEPSKELERLIVAHDVKHGGNEILRWMAGNVAIKMNGEGYIRPHKKSSTERVDGIVAAIIAIGLAVTNSDVEEDFMPSVL